jgi:hypothetical protein
LRIYGIARKVAPDEQGHQVIERGAQFDVQKDREVITTSRLQSKSSCDCDDADIDKTYRMCCISLGNSPSFDTGAHASFVNREVASWIEEHGRTDRQAANVVVEKE